MKNKLINSRITIIGLGLIGGSLAMTLKDKGFTNVVGFSKNPKTTERAQQLGAINRVAHSLKESVDNSDIVVICTPILQIEQILKKIRNHLKDGCIVTDVGSTKKVIVEEAEKVLPKQVFFVGGHPMAGKETSGIEHADKNLFQGCTWCLTPTRVSNKTVVKEVEQLVSFIGAKPKIIKADAHDEAVAGISHLPFLLSTLLINTVTEKNSWPTARKLAASGFRDITRLANGNIEMHADVCQTNKDNIIALLNQFIQEAQTTKRFLQMDEKENLIHRFRTAKKQREDWFLKSRFNGRSI